ncbi:hypothetical protein KCK33_004506 [Salmonella enterica]|nr:hypothetical protein [Salmonella enterica]EGA0602505.1 hypothetical protein [Salmonella enterica]EHD2148103.1 hypothetical protein [Salmonella enterica]EHK2354325.1 hypothetical protein [Salmonella enterica]
MTITAYSRTFKRELDAKQLESLFDENNADSALSFRDFVKADIECPACNVSGGHYVAEAKSQSKGNVVKQAHFAFRDSRGKDTHLPFCDFYTGSDKLNVVSNDGRVDFMRSGSEATQLIGLMVCAGIEANIFTQQDIRNMRQWFLDLREQGSFIFNLNPHIVQIAKASLIRNKRNRDQYVVDVSETKNSWFDIDNEVYQSLYFKFPELALDRRDNPELWGIRLKGVVTKAKSIIVKDSGTPTFDRSILSEKYQLATQVASLVRGAHPRLRVLLGYSSSPLRSSNPLMAFAALLLFVSDWDATAAEKKIEAILAVKTVTDITAGNVVGLNPFIHYSAWILVKALYELQSELEYEVDFDAEFNSEKERLIKLYFPGEP